MPVDQKMAPLFDALCLHTGEAAARLHVPGHRLGAALPEALTGREGRALYEFDLTELPGLDDLHRPAGAIAEAEGLAARAFGAWRTFFLVNGSTAGIHALMTAVGGKKVLAPRDAHRSVIGGLVLSGAEPVYVWPGIVPGFGIAAGFDTARYAEALAEHPDTAAVLVLYPNYYGVAGDLAGLARLCRSVGKPLLVDEAHGAHLRFHPELPADAMTAGADASVQSTHKFGGSLTQSSMLHLAGPDYEKAVAGALSLLQTTSPSYVLMASLDLARRQMALVGEKLLKRALDLARYVRGRLEKIKGIAVLAKSDLPCEQSLDNSKLVISVRDLGLTGYQAAEILSKRHRVFVEMADNYNLVVCVTIGATREDCDSLVLALKDLARSKRAGGKEGRLPELPAAARQVMLPRAAWFAAAEQVPLEEAEGRVSAETAAVHPPGIPVLTPGEEITGDVLDYLRDVRRLGLTCHGQADPMLKSLMVVIE